jgi:hypothetical protein
VVGAPVTVALNVSLFAVPEETVKEAGGVIVTVGAGKIVTVAAADKPGSSYDAAVTVTVAGEGTVEGAW